MQVSIVDYGNGNFGSLIAALRRLSIDPAVWRTGSDVTATDLLIFPGVGALPEVKATLVNRNLLEPIEELHARGTPTLGICLGMQLFFETGAEGGEGFGWLKGTVPALDAPVLPHIGWNTVQPAVPAALWHGLAPDPSFYFVHTYCVEAADPAIVAGRTTYFQSFPSVIVAPPLYGLQFHPELSGQTGSRLLANLLGMIG